MAKLQYYFELLHFLDKHFMFIKGKDYDTLTLVAVRHRAPRTSINRSALPLRLSKNSLFEDFCEFGLCMALGNKKMKERVAKLLAEASEGAPAEFKALAQEWIANKDDAEKTKEIAPNLNISYSA